VARKTRVRVSNCAYPGHSGSSRNQIGDYQPPAIVPAPARCPHREKDMSASDDKKETVSEKSKRAQEHDEHMEDEEKILAGRKDVNYPALLTKDVPGG
jgi:hypothetical protein